MLQPALYLATGFTACLVGALPFGLVNLSVLETSMRKGTRGAMQIAHGAALIEIIFGLTAILAGSLLSEYVATNSYINLIIVAVLIVAGTTFILKKKKNYNTDRSSSFGFLKGMVLNLISIQVLLFWIIAITFLSAKGLVDFHPFSILLFIIGIWLGKITVLRLYIFFSKKFVSGSQMLQKNINRIIGLILFAVAAFQVIKI